MIHSQEKKQSVPTEPEMFQMLELANKDLKGFVLSRIPKVKESMS